MHQAKVIIFRIGAARPARRQRRFEFVSSRGVAGLLALFVSISCQRSAEIKAPSKPAKEQTAPAQAEATPHGDEWLGPKDSQRLAAKKHPLLSLMSEQRSQPRAELIGQHPRVFLAPGDIETLRTKARTTHRHLWRPVLANLRAFTTEPPAPPAQARRSQNVVGLGIAEAALAYVIEGETKYLQAAKKWMDAAVSYDIWGYAYNKPNIDLAAGHLLFGLGWGYDLLYNDLSESERNRYRRKLVRQAKLLYDYYEVRPGRTYAYSQNHVYIPMAGLGVAAYALYGEVPEAARWARLSRAIMGRSLDTYSADGYFYESFEYWVFAAPWLVIWTSAHEHFTGEKLFDRPGFRNMHLYVAHIVLPDATHVFDFADAFTGSLTRSGKTDDFERTHPGGNLHSNYNLLHATASWFKDDSAQGVARHFADAGHVTWYGFMSMLWFDASIEAKPLATLPSFHHFEDHGVVFHRSDWSKSATAVAFKCGPPEGYATEKRLSELPDWHLSSGHAHPDANSLIIVANGEYLTGDSGYSGVPRTDQHNTVLINDHGQRFTPDGHNAFKGAAYGRLTQVKLQIKQLDAEGLRAVGDATAAYPSKLGMSRFVREVTLDGDELRVVDTLQAQEPATFTALWHSDGPIKSKSSNAMQIVRPRARLDIDFAAKTAIESTVEPNWMTGPGRPGSVQKGKREARGFRVRVSNKRPSPSVVLKTQLKIKRGEFE